MPDYEEQIKLDANEELMNSKGFFLTVLTSSGQLKYIKYANKLQNVERSGLLVTAREWADEELQGHMKSETFKTYPDGDDDDSEVDGSSLDDNLNP